MQQERQPATEYDLFLSYCHTDRSLADAFARISSDRGLRVWYDQYIQGGKDWRGSIVDALGHSSVLLILFSEESNRSSQLIKEIAIADRLGKLVIPVLIQDVEPTGAYLYEMASRNWILLHPDPASRLGSLVDQLLLQIRSESGDPPAVSHGTAPQPSEVRRDREHEYPTSIPGALGAARLGQVTAAEPPKTGWFPLRWYDFVVLGPILVADFIWEASRTSPGDNAGAGFNMVAIVAYMFVLAFRNARLNRGIFSVLSFLGYVAAGLLVLPFGILPDWLGNTGKGDYASVTFGLVLVSFLAAAGANVVQVVLRRIFLRRLFRDKIKSPLPQ